MRTRFPLFAKILLWFFLNVVFLIAVFIAVALFQFKFGLDSLLSGPAGDTVQKLADGMAAELRHLPRDQWDDLLERSSKVYNVRFYLFQNGPPLDQLAGEPVILPQEVRVRMQRRGGGPPPGRRGGGLRGGQEFDEPPGARGQRGPLPENMGRGGPPPRSMVHSSVPDRYWVIVPILPDQVQQQQSLTPLPMPATLVMSSETLSAGGLFFNATPWLVAALGVVVISALFWFPLVRGITRSVSEMTRATERIAEGRFDVRTQVERRDELGSLSEAIDRMAVRLSGLVTGQKRFLGDIAHELCSPIARIQVALGILEQRADEKQKARLDDLREEVEQMSGLVNELLSFSRASLGQSNLKLQPVLARQLVQRAVERECGSEGDADIRIDIAEDLRVIAEPELLLRAVANVLRNALRYAAKAGPITISATRESEKIVLSIEDCGPGVPEAALQQIFDPFYRVDSSRTRDTGGVGLGLSIVKTCIESCGGTVGCENRQPSGLRIIIRLPSDG